MTLKDRVKALAQERGISLPALESELGFGNSTIVKWDKSTPNADKLNAVAKYFNVTMDYLLNGDSEEHTDRTMWHGIFFAARYKKGFRPYYG